MVYNKRIWTTSLLKNTDILKDLLTVSERQLIKQTNELPLEQSVFTINWIAQ